MADTRPQTPEEMAGKVAGAVFDLPEDNIPALGAPDSDVIQDLKSRGLDLIEWAADQMLDEEVPINIKMTIWKELMVFHARPKSVESDRHHTQNVNFNFIGVRAQ